VAGVRQILRKYKDRKIDLADACLIRLADEFESAEILTLDKDFTIYRWGKNKPFRILLDLNLHGLPSIPSFHFVALYFSVSFGLPAPHFPMRCRGCSTYRSAPLAIQLALQKSAQKAG
jgi:hypothetical protein